MLSTCDLGWLHFAMCGLKIIILPIKINFVT